MAKRKRLPRTAKYKTTVVPLRGRSVKVYASPKISEALGELVEDLNLYQGVRFAQILEAVYEQGKKDGARTAFEAVETQLTEARKAVPHRLPGRPRRA